jgi:hypothetical protein
VDLKTVRAQIRQLQRQEEELIASGFRERLPALRELVGKTFVSHMPPWDTYFKVLELVEVPAKPYAFLILEEVVIDLTGKVDIKLESRRIYGLESWRFESCDLDEYDLMRSAALETMADPVVLRAHLAEDK